MNRRTTNRISPKNKNRRATTKQQQLFKMVSPACHVFANPQSSQPQQRSTIIQTTIALDDNKQYCAKER
jgi:hypothetical protein